ncbi:hypothetical protein BSC11_24930, partial [Salmonella enterica]|nr:hypothetical protein [Salmonella enterica]
GWTNEYDPEAVFLLRGRQPATALMWLSVNAHLTHPVLPPGSGVKAVRRVWVDNSGGGYPAFTQLTHQGPNR